jgi:hypothetical protein
MLLKGGALFKSQQGLKLDIESWTKDRRLVSCGSGTDCGPVTLSFLGVPEQIIKILQQQSQGVGMSIEKLMASIKVAVEESGYGTITYEGKPIDFSKIKSVVKYLDYKVHKDLAIEYLYNNLEKDSFFLILGIREERIGHYFIMGKDSVGLGRMYLIDPQNNMYYYGYDIRQYLDREKFIALGLISFIFKEDKIPFVTINFTGPKSMDVRGDEIIGGSYKKSTKSTKLRKLRKSTKSTKLRKLRKSRKLRKLRKLRKSRKVKV